MDITISDILIPITSLLAISIAVYCDDPKWKRWGPVIGMLGQPLWVIESFMVQSWGIFVLSVIYLFVWAGGIKKYWL